MIRALFISTLAVVALANDDCSLRSGGCGSKAEKRELAFSFGSLTNSLNKIKLPGVFGTSGSTAAEVPKPVIPGPPINPDANGDGHPDTAAIAAALSGAQLPARKPSGNLADTVRLNVGFADAPQGVRRLQGQNFFSKIGAMFPGLDLSKSAMLENLNMGVLKFPKTPVVEGLLTPLMNAIQSFPGVDFVEKDVIIPKTTGVNGFMKRRLQVPETDTSIYFNQWEQKTAQAWGTNVEGAHGSVTGTNVTVVAIIDTGIDYFHNDLFDSLYYNIKQGSYLGDCNEDRADTDGNGYIDDCIGWNFIADNNDPFDASGTGTFLAGIVASWANPDGLAAGVCPDCSVLALKACDDTGCSESAIISAMDYAIAKGVRVSLHSYGTFGTPSPVMQSAFERARTADQPMIVITNAGDDAVFMDQTTFKVLPGGYNGDHIVTVAATTADGVFAAFSNYGPKFADVAAPGVQIYSTLPDNQYASASGTAYAAAQVAGIVGLILSKQPTLAYTEIVKLLVNKGTAIPSPRDAIRVRSGKIVSAGAIAGVIVDKTFIVSDAKAATVVADCSANLCTAITNSECLITEGGLRAACYCADGYKNDGAGGCVNIDECDFDPCTTLASCADTDGSFTCTCPTGFTGDGLPIVSGGNECTDDDECAAGTSPCATHATCVNTPGSFQCNCNVGYAANPTALAAGACDNIDECATSTHTCNAKADCTDTDGSFTCACMSGWFGDGINSCMDVDECKDGSHTCAADTYGRTVCKNTPGAFECNCPGTKYFLNDGLTPPTGRCVNAYTTAAQCALPSNVCGAGSECKAIQTVFKKNAYACACAAATPTFDPSTYWCKA